MKLYSKMKLIVLIIILGISSVNATGEANSVNAILDLGKQMSNMRNMLETYALIATKVNYKSPDKRLQQGIAEYESTIDTMDKNFKYPEIVESVRISREAWKPVKTALLTALKDNSADRLKGEGLFIHGNIRTVIKELANMKKHLLTKEKIKDGKELNAAIEIAASSQRLSAHYMMKMWGLDDPTIQQHWDNGVKIYKDSIKTLKESPYYKDPEFKKLLDDTETQLNYFLTVIMFNDKFVPVLVHDKAQKAYNDANKMSEIILSKI
ncbi:Nitric oxide-responding transcriptional regulator Dnr (Crp/Fnr family) [hydrothermal vent metagenome]|uniref:Nitric oxide-responding transcriptional regulator Dnr (Crp/Fnr family) n=1 Tax=hydrothermal vent metagenome TaxID=652676 RepID=A0A1W1BMD2_9ZZZZ